MTPKNLILTSLAAMSLAACNQTSAPAPTPPATPAAPSASSADPRAATPTTNTPTTPATPDQAGGLAIGAAAPMTDTAMLGTDGAQHTIASVAGPQGTLVVFTCVHCPFAQKWESRIVALGNTYRDRGIGVIAINANDPEEYPTDGIDGMRERVQATSTRFPYVVDATSNLARAYGALKTPEVFLFDPQWRLVYHGAVDDNANEASEVQSHYLRDALEARLAGRAPASPTTRAIGCGIKFRPQV